MGSSDRYYHFQELDREILYDVERVRAYALDDIEARLAGNILAGKSTEESVRLLEAESLHTRQDIKNGLQNLTKRGFFVEGERISYQELSRTYALTLNVTQACNLQCKYCYVEKSSMRSSSMSGKVAHEAVDFIFGHDDLESVGIAFYGGEPLLNFPVIRSTIELASRKAEQRGIPPVKYHITTNGTLLTDDIIDFFRDYQINVMVSIDGPREIHDAFRTTPAGNGTHALVSRNLAKLMRSSGSHKVSASGVVTNRGRLKDAYDYLSRSMLRDIKLSYVRYLDEKDYGLTDVDKHQYMDDMRHIARKTLKELLQGSRPPYYNFETNILQLWKGSKRGYFCPAGKKRFGVSPDGDLYPCGPAAAMQEWKLGTIAGGLETGAMDAWADTASFENRSDCRKCWARYLCAGGCPLRLVRSFDEQRCEINQHSVRLAIAIFTAVQEENEMMLAALVDEDFLFYLRGMMLQATSA